MTLEVKVFERVKVTELLNKAVAKIKKAIAFVVVSVKKLIGATRKGSGTISGPPAKVKRKGKTKQV